MKDIEELKKENRMLEEAANVLGIEPEALPAAIRKFKKDLD
ncbi:MAG TPA: hypothetical protein VJH90_00265 [archaeon]|nr:hypothetical protein [archaeon]